MTRFRLRVAQTLAAVVLASTLGAEEKTVSAGEDGFTIRSEGGDYRLRVTGYAQADGRFFLGDAEARLATDSFLLRRVRPIVLGTLAKRFDFYLVPDFGDGKTVIQDAYLDARFSPKARLRVGKSKTPFGLERLQSATSLLFVERALPTAIVPNRDVGVQIHGEIKEGVFSYAAAVLNGVADGGSADADSNDGKDVAGRIFFQPFKKQKQAALKGLGFGIAATWGRQQGVAALPTYRTPGQLAFFSYTAGAVAEGTRWRISPQAQFYGGPVSVLAEYASSRQEIRKDTISDELTNDSWQVAVAWLLAGEKATGGAVKPRKPIGAGKGGRGAFELAARVHGLGVDEAAFRAGFADPTKSARKATAWAVGLNWYVNRNVKYVVGYEQTSFEGGAKDGNRPSEKTLLLRAQVAF